MLALSLTKCENFEVKFQSETFDKTISVEASRCLVILKGRWPMAKSTIDQGYYYDHSSDEKPCKTVEDTS